MIELFFVLIAFLAAITLLLLIPVMRSDKKAALQVAGFICAVSFGIYAFTGSPRAVPLARDYQEGVKSLNDTIKSTSAAIAAKPDNLEAWLVLSQALMDKGDYRAATNGFKQAVLLSHGHPRIIMGYAEAQILAADGKVTDEAKKSVDMALKIDPALPLARYYHAVWMLQNGKQSDAMKKMKKLYQELPDADPLKQRMKSEIGR